MSDKKQTSFLISVLPYAVVTLAASFGATQFVADRFHRHPDLGSPWFFGYYAPWNWIIWEIQFRKLGPQTFTLVNLGVLVFVILIFYMAQSRYLYRKRQSVVPDGVHGTAHFADNKEVAGTGLLLLEGEKSRGVYVGAWKEPYTFSECFKAFLSGNFSLGSVDIHLSQR